MRGGTFPRAESIDPQRGRDAAAAVHAFIRLSITGCCRLWRFSSLP
jgi:hypothetical protein